MKRQNTLSDILSSRQENFRLALVAIVAALAVGVFSSSIVTLFQANLFPILVSSGLVVLLSIIWIVSQVRHYLYFEDKIEAVFLVDRKTKEPISIQGYDFSTKFFNTLRAIAAENRAIYSEWEKGHEIDKELPKEGPQGESNNRERSVEKRADSMRWTAVTKVNTGSTGQSIEPPSFALINEITEYLILEELSLHLSTFFNDEDEGSPFVSEMQRKDIPGFLLENRVLNLLSTPIEQRDIFFQAFPEGAERPKGEIHLLAASNGARYSRFDLTLPSKSVVSKTAEGFRIETKRFILEVSCRASYYSAVLPGGYCELYLNRNYRDVNSRKISIKISGRVKPLSILQSRGWKYHAWLDSFRERIDEKFSFSDYFDRIDWEVSRTIIRANIHKTNEILKKYTEGMRSDPKSEQRPD